MSDLGNDPQKVVSDAAMIRQAIAANRISEDKRQALMDRLMNVALDENTKPRALNAIAKTLAVFDRTALAAARDIKQPSIIVVNNNTNAPDTLTQAASSFNDPEDAQRFLELIAKSNYRPLDDANKAAADKKSK